MRYPASMRPVLLALLLVACSPGLPQGEETEAGRDTLGRTPAELVREWVAMWNTYDSDQVRELFLPDDRLTYFSSEIEGAIRGYEAVMEHHRGFGFVPGGQGRGTRLWLEALTEDQFEAAAVLTGIWYFQRDEPETGDRGPGTESGIESGETSRETGAAGSPATPPGTQPGIQRGPVTFVCVLEGGRWWFAHMNFGNYAEEGGAA